MFDIGSVDSLYYIASIKFFSCITDTFPCYTYFVKLNQCDCCSYNEYSIVVGRGKRGGPRWGKRFMYSNIDTAYYSSFNRDDIQKFIIKSIANIVKRDDEIEYENNNRKEKFGKLFNKYFNLPIFLIESKKERLNYNFKFKFLSGFKANDQYMEDTFINELKFVDARKVDKYIFMLPRYKEFLSNYDFSDYVFEEDFQMKILNFFKQYGFSNVQFIDETEVKNY